MSKPSGERCVCKIICKPGDISCFGRGSQINHKPQGEKRTSDVSTAREQRVKEIKDTTGQR